MKQIEMMIIDEIEMIKDKALASRKAGVLQPDLKFEGIMTGDDMRLYLWTILDSKSEQFGSTICGKIWRKEN